MLEVPDVDFIRRSGVCFCFVLLLLALALW